MGIVAGREDRAALAAAKEAREGAVVDRHGPAVAAQGAIAAGVEGEGRHYAEGRGVGAAAVAAAPAHALRLNADGTVAQGDDVGERGRGSDRRSVAVDGDVAALAAGAAGAAHRIVGEESQRAGLRARAAAAAQALSHDAGGVRALCADLGVVAHRDLAAVARSAARTTDGHKAHVAARQRHVADVLAAEDRDAAGDGNVAQRTKLRQLVAHVAVAAAAADALGLDAGGVLAGGQQPRRVGDQDDAAVARSAARAADGHKAGVGAAVAAAAADALGEDRLGIVAFVAADGLAVAGDDLGPVVHGHRAALAGDAAVAAHHQGAEAEATVAAATAHRLGVDAGRLVAVGDDTRWREVAAGVGEASVRIGEARHRHPDIAAIAARAGLAKAEVVAHRHQGGLGAGRTAAPADALGVDAGGGVALGQDVAGLVDGDAAAIAAGLPGGAERDGAGSARVAGPAVTAAAADALGEDAVGAAEAGGDGAGVGHRHLLGVAGLAARTAERDAQVLGEAGLTLAGELEHDPRAGERPDVAGAAGPAAAAQALGLDA